MKIGPWAHQRGTSLIEVVFAAGLVATLGAIVVPSVTATVEDARALAATRYVAGRLREARTEAVKRSANAALRFRLESRGDYTYAGYVDGNGDGVRQQDIERNVDTALRPGERLRDRFPNVAFGTLEGLPPPDSSASAPGDDPIRIGNTELLSFSPLGTATSGSLYILGKNRTQYAIRILGETGRVRILKFDRTKHAWRPL